MTFIFLVVTLAVTWAAVTGTFTLPNLLLGAVVGGIAALFIRYKLDSPYILRRMVRVIRLGLLFITELMISAWKVAVLVCQPDLKSKLKPAFLAYPLTVQSDVEITLLANLITLTPGTLSVDVSSDRRFLLIHALEMTDRDAMIQSIRDGFEARIREVYEP